MDFSFLKSVLWLLVRERSTKTFHRKGSQIKLRPFPSRLHLSQQAMSSYVANLVDRVRQVKPKEQVGLCVAPLDEGQSLGAGALVAEVGRGGTDRVEALQVGRDRSWGARQLLLCSASNSYQTV